MKKVILDRLIELLQYAPQTPNVFAEPILITPAWIMKYYILDLSPRNSLVRYLVEQGHTVFMISWKNPDAADRELGMDDYVRLGFQEALAEVRRRVPQQSVHAVGYCIGGTLLAIAAAQLAARHEAPLASISLFAAQTDFSAPGELSVFITRRSCDAQAMMWKEGVLDSRMMGGAFQMLRTYDLLWSPAAAPTCAASRRFQRPDGVERRRHAHGVPHAQRLPAPALSQNDLAAGRCVGLGDELDLANVTVPCSSWVPRPIRRTVAFRLQGRQARALGRFHVLSHERRPQRRHHQRAAASKHRHRVRSTKAGSRLLSADRFLETVEPQQGSWWPTWGEWLAAHSSAAQVKPPKMGAARKGYKPLEAAPGTYVLQR
jgi:polyhydroxyalkanoate synthase